MDDNQLKTNNNRKKFIYNSQIQESISTEIKYKYPNLKIAIIIPTYNEEKNIKKTLLRVPNDISDKLDVIVVDDGSTDKSVDIAKCFNTIILKHKKNKGYGAAIQTGLEYVKENNYDILIFIDADGQHDPKYLPKFIDPILKNGIDFVIGNRFKYYCDMSCYKRICSKLMTAFYFIFLLKKIPDPTNGYRALSSKLVSSLDLESNYSTSQEMLFKVAPSFKYEVIPIKINQREYGKSFIRLKKYFYKIFFFFLKYYLFPKFRKITKKLFSERTREFIGHCVLKT